MGPYLRQPGKCVPDRKRYVEQKDDSPQKGAEMRCGSSGRLSSHIPEVECACGHPAVTVSTLVGLLSIPISYAFDVPGMDNLKQTSCQRQEAIPSLSAQDMYLLCLWFP